MKTHLRTDWATVASKTDLGFATIHTGNHLTPETRAIKAKNRRVALQRSAVRRACAQLSPEDLRAAHRSTPWDQLSHDERVWDSGRKDWGR